MRPAVARHDIGQLGDRARLGVAGQQQVEHRHEVALAGAETAVQVRGLAAPGLHGLLDEAQGIAEGIIAKVIVLSISILSFAKLYSMFNCCS